MKTLLLAATLAFAPSCAAVGPVGMLYTGTRNPAQFDAGETTNMGAQQITGESCATGILGLVAFGDWSVDAALRAAGAEGKTLKNIAVDHRILSVLFGIYASFCTRVTAQVAQ